MNWNDVEHQPAALSRLDRALRGQRLPHSYLFEGPRGVGKRMTALRLARRLLCTAATDLHAARDACGRCDDCAAVEAGTHLDLHLVHRGLIKFHDDAKVRSRTAIELGVDVVRVFVIEVAGRRAARGRAKVFIIQDADRMNVAAQNALLKTLEEPPGGSYLVMLTTSADRLLPTVRSRCQTVPFGRLPDAFVARRLRALPAALADADVAWLTALADGQLGEALALARASLHTLRERVVGLVQTALADPLAFSRAAQELVQELAATEFITEREPASDAAAARAAQQLVLNMVATTLRDTLRYAVGAAEMPQPADAGRLAAAAKALGRAGTPRAIRAVATADYDLARHVNVGLTFDVLGLSIARAAGA